MEDVRGCSDHGISVREAPLVEFPLKGYFGPRPGILEHVDKLPVDELFIAICGAEPMSSPPLAHDLLARSLRPYWIRDL
jgi:hypothetical protein